MPPLSKTNLTRDVEIRLHYINIRQKVKKRSVTSDIHQALPAMIRVARPLYRQHGIEMTFVTLDSMVVPGLDVVAVDSRDTHDPTEEQDFLVNQFRKAYKPQPNDIVVFMAEAILDFNGETRRGCAYESNGFAATIVSGSQGTIWTFGHEIGHLLGLGHESSDTSRLMFHDTKTILDVAKPRPIFTWHELLSMRFSPLVSIVQE